MYSPKYVITNQVLKNIGGVEASKEVIENAPLIPAYEKQFQTDAAMRTIHHGTHIEGNDLTLLQTKKVLEGEEIFARPRDVQEVVNYRNVMNLLDDLSHKRGEYDTDILLEIHKETVTKIVPEEKTGVLRKTQVVVKEESTGQVIFAPPSAVEVPYLIQDFFEWFNSASAKDIHPVLRAGIAHYVLVAIHPFVEGNGRTVRAFSTLVMMKEGYDIKKFFSIEEHFDHNLEEYYSAFAQVDKQATDIGERDLTPWLEYFTGVVAVELEKIKERVRKLSMDTKLKNTVGKQVALTERQMKLVEYISDHGSAIMQEVSKVLPMVSDDTVLRDLKDLMHKGIIRKEGSTKSARYTIATKRKYYVA